MRRTKNKRLPALQVGFTGYIKSYKDRVFITVLRIIPSPVSKTYWYKVSYEVNRQLIYDYMNEAELMRNLADSSFIRT